MNDHRDCVVVAISGPDGAGKSTLVRHLSEKLQKRGFAVVTEYTYGCFLCRRIRKGHGQSQLLVLHQRSSKSRAHALLDATELGLRVLWARLRARLICRGRSAAVVTDRGPLDGLVKFDPSRSWVAALFTAISRLYHVTMLLDAPAPVLAIRDAEHPPDELDTWRDRYRHWESRLPSLTRLDTGARSAAAVADEAARLVSAAAVGAKAYDNLAPHQSPSAGTDHAR